MSEAKAPPTGPDLTLGVDLASIQEGKPVLGHAGGEAVILVRHGQEIFAVGATCSHYGGPLAEGLQLDGTIRCPWHHACFDLRTGVPTRAPALNPVPCYDVERKGNRVVVGAKKELPKPARIDGPESVVIVGAGAAGFAAAETLRSEGYEGPVTLIGADPDPPYDRPNLSKDYLAGKAPEEWIPLRSAHDYRERKIDLRNDLRATGLDVRGRILTLSDGSTLLYDALLLATGAEPVRLTIPGADLPHVHYLRTLADSRAIVAQAEPSKRAVVLGASFIGLEVAASLRARGVEVDVVAPDARPLERILGPEVGDFLRALHEGQGVRFHLGQTAKAIDAAQGVTLSGGKILPADFVVAGIGVRPLTSLAEQAGIAVDRGVLVDEYLATSAHGVWAAGDIASWPDRRSGERIRVEHWVVAERQGQAAARNILGRKQPFDAVPFFWTAQYDVTLNYVGHARSWDRIEIDGKLEERDCSLRYLKDGRSLAVLTIGRDLESLEAELAMERAK